MRESLDFLPSGAPCQGFTPRPGFDWQTQDLDEVLPTMVHRTADETSEIHHRFPASLDAPVDFS